MSYLSTDAAPSFIYLLKDYLHYRKSYSIAKSLEILQQTFMNGFHTILNTLFEDLHELNVIYEGRQPMDKALGIITGKFEKYLTFRSENLLFDLEPFDPNTSTCDLPRLEKLLFSLVPSCDIRQVLDDQDEHKINRDLLRSFDARPIDLNGNIVDTSYFMQVFQCAFRYFRAHWTFDSFIRSEIAIDRCPYYSTCDLPIRVNKPEVCNSHPWLSLSSSNENCMYGTAVAALLGHVNIKTKNQNS